LLKHSATCNTFDRPSRSRFGFLVHGVIILDITLVMKGRKVEIRSLPAKP